MIPPAVPTAEDSYRPGSWSLPGRARGREHQPSLLVVPGQRSRGVAQGHLWAFRVDWLRHFLCVAPFSATLRERAGADLWWALVRLFAASPIRWYPSFADEPLTHHAKMLPPAKFSMVCSDT